jgi:hypothetical protein
MTPAPDQSGYVATVHLTRDVTRDETYSVDARVIAGSAAALACELVTLAADYDPDAARQAITHIGPPRRLETP